MERVEKETELEIIRMNNSARQVFDRSIQGREDQLKESRGKKNKKNKKTYVSECNPSICAKLHRQNNHLLVHQLVFTYQTPASSQYHPRLISSPGIYPQSVYLSKISLCFENI